MKKAADLLGAFFDEKSLNTARGYSELFTAWKSVAGERISAHSRIVELEKTILVIEADHPGWVQIIQIQQAALLEAVRRRFPDLHISGIALRLQRDGKSSSTEKIEAQNSMPDALDIDKHVKKLTFEGGLSPKTPYTGDPYENFPDGELKDILRKLEHSIRTRKHDR